MKTLIIPDIHLETHWADEMLTQHQPQRVILLGDYFDLSPQARGQRQLESIEDQSVNVVRWLADLIAKYGNDITVLIGNHDAPYLFPDATIHIYAKPEPVFKTHHYREPVQQAIEVLQDEIALIRAKTVWYHNDEQTKYLFTHAGVSAEIFGNKEGVVTLESIATLVGEGITKAYSGAYHRAFGIGKARGGSQPVGGLTWLHFNAEFKPVEGFRQIVGHTAQMNGFNRKDENYCLDGMQSTVGIIEDDELRVMLYDEKLN